MQLIHTLFVAVILACLALAHPREKHDPAHLKREIATQKAWATHGKRTLNNCARSESARALQARNIKRRELKTRELRENLAQSGSK